MSEPFSPITTPLSQPCPNNLVQVILTHPNFHHDPGKGPSPRHFFINPSQVTRMKISKWCQRQHLTPNFSTLLNLKLLFKISSPLRSNNPPQWWKGPSCSLLVKGRFHMGTFHRSTLLWIYHRLRTWIIKMLNTVQLNFIFVVLTGRELWLNRKRHKLCKQDGLIWQMLLQFESWMFFIVEN